MEETWASTKRADKDMTARLGFDGHASTRRRVRPWAVGPTCVRGCIVLTDCATFGGELTPAPRIPLQREGTRGGGIKTERAQCGMR